MPCKNIGGQKVCSYPRANWWKQSMGIDFIGGGSSSVETPTIQGTATIGSELSIVESYPESATYQWKRDGVNISAATNSTYTLVTDDANTDITVTVTVGSQSATSASVSITVLPITLIGAANMIFYDPDGSGNVVDGSNNITTGNDQGSGNYDLSGVVGNYPVQVTDGNGNKFWRFTESAFTFPTLATFSTSANDYYELWVFKQVNSVYPSTEIGTSMSFASGNRVGGAFGNLTSNLPSVYALFDSNGGVNTTITSPSAGPLNDHLHIVERLYRQPNMILKINGVTENSNSSFTKHTFAPTSGNMGSAPGVATSNNLKGDVGAVIIAKGTYSDSVTNAVRRFYERKYPVAQYPNLAFTKNNYTDVNNILESVIFETTAGTSEDYLQSPFFFIHPTTGYYYLVFNAGSTHNNSDDARIVFTKSTDKGVTWSNWIYIADQEGVRLTPGDDSTLVGDYTTTSTTSINLATATAPLAATIGLNLTIAGNEVLRFVSQSDPTQYFTGTITSYTSGTGAVTLNPITVTGTATKSDWIVYTRQRVTAAGISYDSTTGRIFVGYNRSRRFPTATGDWDTRLIYTDDDFTTVKLINNGVSSLLTTSFPTPGQFTSQDPVHRIGDNLFKIGYGRTASGGSRGIYIFRSTDSGETWSNWKTVVPDTEPYDFEEPSLISIGQGVWMCYLRSDPQNGTFLLISWDDMVTWVSSAIKYNPFDSTGYNGGCVTPSGGVFLIGREITFTPRRTSIQYSNNKGMVFGVSRLANATDYGYLYGNAHWDSDLGCIVGIYAEDIGAVNGPTRIVLTNWEEI